MFVIFIICLLNLLYFVCCRVEKLKTENENEESRKVIKINTIYTMNYLL